MGKVLVLYLWCWIQKGVHNDMSLSIHDCEQGEHLSGFLIAYQVLAARVAYNLVPSSWVLPQAAALFLSPVSLRSSGAQGRQQKNGHLLCGQFKEILKL